MATERGVTSMGLLSVLPTEILIQCLVHLDAQNLLTLLSVSSALRSVVSQDILWEPHCEKIYNKGCIETLGWRKVCKPDILPSDYDAPELPYHMIWRRMHLCEDYLGWWLTLEQGPAGIIMQISLRGDRLVVSHAIPTSDIPVSGAPRGHVFALSWHNDFQIPLLIDSDSVIVEEYSVSSFRWLFEGPSSIMHHKYALRNFHTSDQLSAPDWDLELSEDQLPSYDWPSHRSPSLFVVICHSSISTDDRGYASAIGVPALAFPRPPGPRPFIALRSPFESSMTNPLIESGIWLASYGRVHGCEFIYIHIRCITEADFIQPWGTEQNLAKAFSPELRDFREIFGLDEIPPSEVSIEDLRVGGRVIEAIKITGDANVPRGVRTFIGFLDHSSSWSGPREANDFVARPVSHPWPIHPESVMQTGMPIIALPATLSEMKTQDIPARGMTIPGLMRVAETGFVDPKWANATIHIAGRQEIRVMIQDAHHVTTFYKIEKEMLQSIR
ncbi:hypothetical protein FRC12_018141 [Ceratobasidium sp. 428]|nr:hypothetical protein FRC12_018141 [Ceratobasidium sp. 428]